VEEKANGEKVRIGMVVRDSYLHWIIHQKLRFVVGHSRELCRHARGMMHT